MKTKGKPGKETEELLKRLEGIEKLQLKLLEIELENIEKKIELIQQITARDTKENNKFYLEFKFKTVAVLLGIPFEIAKKFGDTTLKKLIKDYQTGNLKSYKKIDTEALEFVKNILAEFGYIA